MLKEADFFKNIVSIPFLLPGSRLRPLTEKQQGILSIVSGLQISYFGHLSFLSRQFSCWLPSYKMACCLNLPGPFSTLQKHWQNLLVWTLAGCLG
jgi:hypothetical protein